jgi:hypothetical protein
LRDAKGQPYVTIETQPYDYLTAVGDNDPAAVAVYNKMGEKVSGQPMPKDPNSEAFALWQENLDDFHDEILYEMGKYYTANPPAAPDIVQIKGPKNLSPDPKYFPQIQDFIRSGKWSNIEDRRHTGLTDAEIDQILKGAQ